MPDNVSADGKASACNAGAGVPETQALCAAQAAHQGRVRLARLCPTVLPACLLRLGAALALQQETGGEPTSNS